MKKIIITGASSGLGKAMVAHFAANGHQVAAVARNTTKIEALQSQYDKNVHRFNCDISKAEEVSSTFTEIEKVLGEVDVLINNAGIFKGGPFEDMSIEDIDKVIDTNLKGYFYCTLQVVKGMKERRSGHIINISSVSGTHAIPNQSIYGASKHGVNGFSDVLAHDLKKYNVKVCAICPGGIDTPLWNEDNPYPLENRLIQPEEITELIDFMLEQKSHTVYRRVIMFPDNEWH